MDSVIVPITVFVLVYIVLTFELVNKEVVILAGVAVLVESSVAMKPYR